MKSNNLDVKRFKKYYKLKEKKFIKFFKILAISPERSECICKIIY